MSVSTCPMCDTEVTHDQSGAECPADGCEWSQPKDYDGAAFAGDGVTVASSTDTASNGSVDTVDWPSGADVPDELEERHRRIIRAAARYPNKTAPEIADEVGLSEDKRPIVYHAIKRHWPTEYDRIKTGKTQVDISGEQVDSWRAALAETDATVVGLAEQAPVASTTIRQYVRGRRAADGETTYPELEYDQGGGGWRAICPDCGDAFANQNAVNSHLEYCGDDGDGTTQEQTVIDTAGTDDGGSGPVVACLDCETHYGTAPDAWAHCPQCGAALTAFTDGRGER